MERMRLRQLARAAGSALLAAGLASLPAHGAAAATNLLTNDSFETGNTSGWTCAQASVVTSPVHSGTHALSGTPTSSDFAQCSQVVSVAPNSAYTLSAWVQGSFVFLGATGTGTTDPSTWTSAAAFTQLSANFSTGPSTTSVTVFVHGWFAQSSYVADDIVLTGPAGSGGGGGTTPPQAPAAPANLRVTGTTSSSVSLSWTAPAGTVTGYNVYQNGTRIHTVTGTTDTVTGLASSTTFTFAVSAVNSAGESPRSTQVQATTAAAGGGGGGGGGGALPKHVLTGYWQNFVNGATPLRLSAVPRGYDLVAVAFADTDPTRRGGVTFTLDSGLSSALGGYTDAQFTSDIQTLHSQGRKVILSVGGQNGTISVGDPTSAANFANSVFGLMQRYGFDGVDIDLENGINPTNMGSALRQLSAQAGAGLVITLAPQTIDMQSTGGGYFQLALNIKDILTIVNTQYYNSGTMLGCDSKVYGQGTEDFETALACIQLQGGLRPDQVGLGLPASASAAGGGVVSPSTVNNALDCLASRTHCGSFVPTTAAPGIRGAMTWSINWDATNGFAFVNTVGAHVHAMP